jgi:hypothetical protein
MKKKKKKNTKGNKHQKRKFNKKKYVRIKTNRIIKEIT